MTGRTAVIVSSDRQLAVSAFLKDDPDKTEELVRKLSAPERTWLRDRVRVLSAALDRTEP